MIEKVVFLLILYCSSITFAQTYNTITVDGDPSDWLAIAATSQTSGSDDSVWYYTWDQNKFYFAISSNLLLSIHDPTIAVLVFFDSNPQPNFVSGNGIVIDSIDKWSLGTTSGPVIGGQQINLPFTADFYIKWRTATTALDAFEFQVSPKDGSGQWVNIDDNGGFFDANVSYSNDNQQGIQFMEIEIARASLGSTNQLYVCGCAISPRNTESFDISPMGNWTIGNHPNLNLYQFYGFVLTSLITPNFQGHINVYATATTREGDFTDPTAWYGNRKVPGSTAIAYIGHQITLNGAASLKHLYVLSSGEFIASTSSTLSMSHGFYIKSDGAFTQNGTINLNDGTILDSANGITFGDVNLFGIVDFGLTSSIANYLSINPNSKLLNNPVTYLESAVLIYNISGRYSRGYEWESPLQSSGRGVPNSVAIQGNTVLDIGALTTTFKLEINRLYIEAGSTITFNAPGHVVTAPLIVDDEFINHGLITLSSAVNGSIFLNNPPSSLGTLFCTNIPTLYISGVPYNFPVVSANGPLNFTYGDSVTLDAGGGYASYLWSNGATTRQIIVTDSGNFTVRVTSVFYFYVVRVTQQSSHCFSISNPVQVTVNLPYTTGSITSGDITTSPITSGDITTSPLTTADMTTSPLTTADVTTADVTTSPLTTAELTTSPLTTADMTTSPLTTADMTTSPLTTAELTTSPLTTAELTTSPLTTAKLTTSVLTSGLITSGSTTAQPIINPGPGKNSNKAVFIAIGAIVGVMILALVPVIVLLRRRRRRFEEEKEVLLKAIY